MYEKIVNPETGRFVKITSQLGKKIINNYLLQIGGGFVDCAKNRGARKKCRKADKGCVYIKAADTEKYGVSSWGCYRQQGETKSNTSSKTSSNNKNKVATIYSLHLVNYDHGDDDIMYDVEVPEYPEDLQNPCYIFNPIENKSTKCYKPTWDGQPDNGKGTINCILDISEESKNKEIKAIWKKHNEKNKYLINKNKKLKSDLEKQNRKKEKELERLLLVGREGDIVWDLSPAHGLYVLQYERVSVGVEPAVLQLVDISRDFEPDNNFPENYWKNAKFQNPHEIETSFKNYIMDELDYFEKVYLDSL